MEGHYTPNLSKEAVERMLVQHLLTERIFRRSSTTPTSPSRNVIAAEIEKVIARTHQTFSEPRRVPLATSTASTRPSSAAPKTPPSYSEKQDFLNTVYERFFQGYLPQRSRHPRHRLHPAAHRGLHGAQRRRNPAKRNSAAPSATKASTSSTPSSAPATSSSASCGRSKPPTCPTNTRTNCTATKSCCCPTTSPA